jgi:hypothetical protein
MANKNHVAATYLAGFISGGLLSYWRGKRGVELGSDTVVHGVIIGSAANVGLWLLSSEEAPTAAVAKQNTISGFGKLPEPAIDLLSNPLSFAVQKVTGLRIAPPPSDRAVITQDDE